MKNLKIAELSLYIFPVVTAGIFLLVASFAIWPTISNFSTRQSELDTLNAQITELDQKYRTVQTLNVPELTQMKDKADVALPTEKSFPGLLSGLEALVKQSGSALNTFDAAPRVISKTKINTNAEVNQQDIVTEKEKSLGLSRLEANIGVKSDAASLIGLTSLLVKSSRLVTLEEVNFAGQEAVGGDRSNVKLRLRVYFQPDEATFSARVLVPINDEEKKLVSQVDAFNIFNLQLPQTLPSREDPFAKTSAPGRIPQASGSSSVQP